MKRKSSVFAVILCCLMMLISSSMTSAAEEKAVEQKDIDKVVNALKGFKFGLLYYLSYQNGETGDMDNGTGYSQFTIKRGYFRVTKEILPWFDAHVTFDVTTIKDPEDVGDPANDYDGSIAVRIKYAYGKIKLPDFAFFTKPFIEVGVVHMPWLDFEEHVNFYRAQDTMFMERNSLFNSADLGVDLCSSSAEKCQGISGEGSSYYPVRYGSMSRWNLQRRRISCIGKEREQANRGAADGGPRLTSSCLQLSYFGLWGKGSKYT